MADTVTKLSEAARTEKPQARISDDLILKAARKPGKFNPYVLPSFPPAVEAALAQAKVSTMAMDELTAGTLSWAAGDAIASSFAEGVVFLGYAYLAQLATRAEYRVVTETIAAELVREWIEIVVASGDKSKTDRKKRIEDELEELEIRDAFRRVTESDGFFGRGHLYLDTGCTDDSEELETDLGNGRDVMSRTKIGPDKPQKLIRCQPVEATWAYPTHYESVDPLKRDWYRPVHWFVMSRQIHRSRFLTFIMREVPDILKPAYAFGGLSMSQMLKPAVDNWIRTRQAVSDIIQNFSFNVLRTNMDATTSIGGDNVLGRVSIFNAIRTNQGTIVIDKESEDWSNVSVPLGGLDHLQAQSQEHMAAIARVPLVKLLGIQPAGLNASSEGELLSFEDWIASAQEFLFRLKLQTILDFVQLSLFGDIDDDLQFKFKPLRQLKPLEEAQLQAVNAQTREGYFQMGAVDAHEVREALAQDPDTPFDGLDLSKPMENPPNMGMPGMGGAPGMGGGAPGMPGASKGALPSLPKPSLGGTGGGGGGGQFGKPDALPNDHDRTFPFDTALDAEFKGEQHPRRGKGQGGGEFVRKGEGGQGGAAPPGKPQAETPQPSPAGLRTIGPEFADKLARYGFNYARSSTYGHSQSHDFERKNKDGDRDLIQIDSGPDEDPEVPHWGLYRPGSGDILAEGKGWDELQQALKKRGYKPRSLKPTQKESAAEQARGFQRSQQRGEVQARVIDILNKSGGMGDVGIMDAATEIADFFDYSDAHKNRIRIEHGRKQFKLGDATHDYAGAAWTSGERMGDIAIYGDVVSPHNVGGVIAHEIGHIKWQTVLDAYHRDRLGVHKRSGEAGFWDKDGVMAPDGSLRDTPAGKAAQQQYSVYARLQPVLADRYSQFERDDGLTDYSREWWQAVNDGKAARQKAEHETLAEMGRLDYEGSLQKLLWYKDSDSWKPLYLAVQDLYPKIAKEGYGYHEASA